MKTLKSFSNDYFSKISILLISFLSTLIVKAQEKEADLNVNVTTTKTTTEWYTNPIYWVIGAVVLIILVALIARGGGNKS